MRKHLQLVASPLMPHDPFLEQALGQYAPTVVRMATRMRTDFILLVDQYFRWTRANSKIKIKSKHATIDDSQRVLNMVLSQEDIDGCRQAFMAFDKDRSGTIDVWELRQVLEAMGQAPTEDELFQMISEVDDNMSGSIDFGEFLKVVEAQQNRSENQDDENDMIDAFVACGGQPDKGGHVKKETLIRIIKHDFGLTIDIEELINKIDTDGS